MLSYQHEYHAGNHADVLKHSVLALLIRALQRKPKPMRVLDTHAGSGTYDLGSPEAQRGREFERGIARVLEERPVPPELAAYIQIVDACNRGDALETYPGSPRIARALLRETDRLELFELHPKAHAALESAFRRDRQVHVHRRDGFEGVLAVVPPPERRGLVLIDPSYETDEDFARVLDVVPALHRRWTNGVIAVWYPLLRRPQAAAFARRLCALDLPRFYRVELEVEPAGGFGLLGSGLAIANLPYGVDAELETLLPWLHRRLAVDGAGGFRARWLTAP